MKSPDLSTRKVRDLRRDLQARQFAVPKLQRNFVWDARRAAKLLDSIYHQMPIGSLFLWEMDRRSAHLIRQAHGVLPPFCDANQKIWFVIDGQQRLSVIHQAFEGEVRENYAGRPIDFGRLCFVVSPESKDGHQTRIVHRKPQGRRFVPLRDILAPDWRRYMPARAPRWFIRKIEACRARLLDYPVPVVTVANATLDEIGEVFIRVNSQGMRVTSADRAIALMGKLDVRAMAEDVLHRVRDQVFALRGIDAILMGFGLIAEKPAADGDPPKLDAVARRWSKRIQQDDAARREFERLWHRYQAAFLTGVDYIHRSFPVHDESYLPSANMLATLSIFFFHHRGQPNASQAAEIRKWFWATGVAQRYSGRGYHRNLVSDARFFEDLALGKRRHFAFEDLLDPVLNIQGAEYQAHAARTRAFFCLLAAQKPRYLDNGEPIPLDRAVVSPANSVHRHHIFPVAQLRHGVAARKYNGLCNICFLVCRDNVRIGMKVPRNYLAEFEDEDRRQFRRVMKSHLIPVGDDSGVWDFGVVRGFKKFEKQRLHLICSAFERAAGMRLFARP